MEAATVVKREITIVIEFSYKLQKRKSSQWHFQNLHKSFKKEMQKTKTKTKTIPNLWHRSDVSLKYFECIATEN